ncbi:MCE family protein [bacterium]|nr:MCE family protein [bacterium]
MEQFFTPFKVGLLVIISVFSFFFFFNSVKKGIGENESSYQMYALFSDATGLTEKSRIQIAGINVGEIKKITLDETGTRAKVTIVVKGDVHLKTDATISKKSSSILGDSYLELTVGIIGTPLPHNSELKNVVEVPSIGSMMDKFDDIAGDIRDMTKELKKVVSDQSNIDSVTSIIKKLDEITKQLNDVLAKNNNKIDLIMDNISTFTKQIAQWSPNFEKQFSDILNNTNQTIKTASSLLKDNQEHFSSILKNLDKILADSSGEMDSIGKSVKNINGITENVNEITDKINRGEGTVGALINSKKIQSDVESMINTASEFTDSFTSLRTIIDAHSEYMVRLGSASHDFGVRFQPNPNKYYFAGVTSSPFDVKTSRKKTVIQKDGTISENQETVYEDTLSWNLYLAMRFYFITLKYGIFESSAGVGADFDFIRDKFVITTRINDFSEDYPNLRVGLRYYFGRHIFLNTGGYYLFDSDRRDFYLGLGATFYDKDLKSIFTVAPSVSP